MACIKVFPLSEDLPILVITKTTIILRSWDETWNYEPIPDVKLETKDGQIYYAHKFKLKYNSEFFKACFSFDPNCKELLLQNIEGPILEEILNYIYKKTIRFKHDLLFDVLIASDYLLIESLKNMSWSAYIGVHNCLPYLNFAFKINMPGLFKSCYSCLQQNFEDSIRYFSAELGLLEFKLLKKIAADKNLNLPFKETMGNLVCSWIEHDLPLRLSFVPELLMDLDIKYTNDSLLTYIVNHPIITDNLHCEPINTLLKSIFHNTLPSSIDKKITSQDKYPMWFLAALLTKIPFCLNVVIKLLTKSNE